MFNLKLNESHAHVCVQSHTCVIAHGSRRRHWIPRTWCYRHLWTTACGCSHLNSGEENVLFRAEPSLQPHCVTFLDKETGESGADFSQWFVCWPFPDYLPLSSSALHPASTGWLSVLRSRLIGKQIIYIINFPEVLRALTVGSQTSYGGAELSQVGWGGNERVLLVLDLCCCLWWWV